MYPMGEITHGANASVGKRVRENEKHMTYTPSSFCYCREKLPRFHHEPRHEEYNIN